MNLDNVKHFIDLAKAEGVSELKCETKDMKISVSFGGQPMALHHPSAMPTNTAIQTPSNTASQTENDPNLVCVTSPFVGTFYTASSPEKPAYVSIGAKVSKGSTLCILEAMKIMNEIESDVSGEIVEICVENESLVEFGQTLFKIRV